jgi:hypothetical protein
MSTGLAELSLSVHAAVTSARSCARLHSEAYTVSHRAPGDTYHSYIYTHAQEVNH